MVDEVRLVACDVGSNAVRLVVARVLGGDRRFLQREASYRVPLRLGDQVFTAGSLSSQQMEQLLKVFQGFRHLIDFFRPAKLRACGTSALREAENGRLATDRVWNETGIRIEIVSGGEEARTILANHLETGLDPRQDYLYVDVGGGSTELTLLTEGKVVRSESFRVGGVRLLGGLVEPREWERMRAWIDDLPHASRPREAIGTGGNISKIYDLVVGTPGAKLTRRRIREVVQTLEPLGAEDRMRRYGLKPDRADVIVPAGKVYYQVLKWAEVKSMLVPKLGVADGVLSKLFHQMYGYHPPAKMGIGIPEGD